MQGLQGDFPPGGQFPRELVVAMRKRNLSVYDIQRELALAGHTISINALAVLLREEGFAAYARRISEPYRAAMTGHFDPDRETWTERALARFRR